MSRINKIIIEKLKKEDKSVEKLALIALEKSNHSFAHRKAVADELEVAVKKLIHEQEKSK